ncbi:predicted protein [Uncinocarpus reesii 1704]|uniref:Major facilitator superfamily (MFS) profile domain-containing protein n=1 Tax=Uncinocarpus reesii (strain UAMH 1704) TaxID=336963 RepID=C4JG86_UNCRE|nr:uncharacterized protein UREG_02484 [Uncinocarpus reesii 1704]EEP77635.1 predicted protein [Uncinocarpus reesii 1704]
MSPPTPHRPLDPPFPPSNRRRRYSYDEAGETNTLNTAETPSEEPVSWRSLPRKGQLTILTIARLAEPLAQTSLQAYVFHQVRSFDPSLPDSTVSAQAGVLQGCFTAAQFVTGVIWGRLADTEFFGRKRVLLIGLLGAGIASIGFGLSRSFATAVVFRTLGGALNSNVGVMRTMIAEIIQGKKYQSRAFLILPMCFNVGIIVGPILGGILADPVKTYPTLFGPGSLMGGKDGVWWMQRWPYALPNFVSALFMFIGTVAVFLGLDEVRTSTDGEEIEASPSANRTNGLRRRRPPTRKVWTRNVFLTLVTHFMLALHTSAFNALCFLFLPTPRAPGSRKGIFHFGAVWDAEFSRWVSNGHKLGSLGYRFQIFVYLDGQFRLRNTIVVQNILPFSPLAYSLAPFLVLLPDQPYVIWPALSAVIFLQVISRTFSLPATVILVNNAVSDPSVLATVHGVAQSVASGARALGPLIAGWGLGLGLKNNIVGAIWWALATEATLGWVLTWTIFEGTMEEKENSTRDIRAGGDEESRG